MSTDRPPTGGPDLGPLPPPDEFTRPLPPVEATSAFPGTGTQPVGPPPVPSWGSPQAPAPQGLVGPYGWGPQQSGPPPHWEAAPPQALGGFAPPAAPPRRSYAWVIALVTVAVVIVISLIAAIALPLLAQLPGRRHPANAPSAPVPGISSSASPTATPSGSASPDPTTAPAQRTMPSDPLDVLKKNPIYGLKVPARCAYQSIPATQAAFRKQVRKLVDCQNAAWKKALAGTPVTFTAPRISFYSTTAKSPCGRLGTTFPASYCTGDNTLYFSKTSYLQGKFFRLSVALFVMHEYAHHVQELAGLFDAMDAMKESEAVASRRIELQAHCIAHYELTVSGVGYNAIDDHAIQYQWNYTNDAKGHGSSRAETFWGKRGLDGKSLGACNTWSVKPSRVK